MPFEPKRYAFHYFHLGKVPYVTLLFLALLVSVFYVWQHGCANGPYELLAQGAKSNALLYDLNEWWRLLTMHVLHVSLVHLIFNLVFLLNLGGAVEACFHRLDYILILIGSALGTAFCSTLFNVQISTGASGIVFGLWGALIAFGIRYHRELPLRYRFYFLGLVLPYGVFAFALGFVFTDVDNAGHLGGFFSGVILGSLFQARIAEKAQPRLRGFLSLVFIMIVVGIFWPKEVQLKPVFVDEIIVYVPEHWQKLGNNINVTLSIQKDENEEFFQETQRVEYFMFSKNQHHYTLQFSAPPLLFARYQKLFQQMQQPLL